MGFRGVSKTVDGKLQSAFVLYINGKKAQGQEAFGREVGVMLEEQIPPFLVRLGQVVMESSMVFDAWNTANQEALEEIAGKYLS